MKFTRDGHVMTAKDRNFWGVTFAPNGDRFYATLSTQGKTYLVQGSVNARGGHLMRGNVECPSLSPDGRRIAYKKRVAADGSWRFHVLDIASGRDVELAEPRSVDDQIEWLDNAHVLYGSDQTVWVLPADDQASRFRISKRRTRRRSCGRCTGAA